MLSFSANPISDFSVCCGTRQRTLHSPWTNVKYKEPGMKNSRFCVNSETWTVCLQINAPWNYFLKYVWQMCFSSYNLKFNVRSSTSACPAICWCRDTWKLKAGPVLSFHADFQLLNLKFQQEITELASSFFFFLSSLFLNPGKVFHWELVCSPAL